MNIRLLFIASWWLTMWLSRATLERDMAMHMTVQAPMLIGLGLLLAAIVRPYELRWLADADWLGIPGIVAVLFGTSFWMLPRALDEAVADPFFDMVKFLSLPLLVGLPLGLSWRRMPSLGRAFIWANFIPKIASVGGLYLMAPTRLCAYYRLDQQAVAGWTLILVAVALGTLWFIAALIGWPPYERKQGSPAVRLIAPPPCAEHNWQRTRFPVSRTLNSIFVSFPVRQK
jgi:hypothetical protein